jgi:Zn-dependent protease
MAFHDRPYSREGAGSPGGWGSGGTGQRLLAMLNASFSIGAYLGIRVRVHITFLLLVAFELLSSRDPMRTLLWIALLFLSVLLHEFGHCIACRRVGGAADEILMWPLGGLAMCRAPRRPWPEFVTVAGGPLVTLILAAGSYLILLPWAGPISLNPLRPTIPALGPLAQTLALLFVVNWVLLLFNLALVFYPFDGGRLVQIALWTRLGYTRSMALACAVGMVGAVVVGILALAVGQLWVALICGFGFYACHQQKQHLRRWGGETADEEDWMAQPRGPSPAERRTERRRRRAQEERRRLDERVDGILDKVHRHGLASLSRREKRILKQGTTRRRFDGG